MPKVYLSPSTQEFNITLSGRPEEYYANLIADAMIPYLEASGIEYGRNTPDMTALSSSQQANEGDYDFYLAIHSNASGEQNAGNTRGAEIYYFPGSVQGRKAAEIFANNYKLIYPLPNLVSVIPLGTLIELNKTRMPAILFETAYHDNQQDLEWLSGNIVRIGRNLALSVADYFGVPFVEPIARGIVTINSGSLNIRRNPNIRSEIVGTLNNGDVISILEAENGWYEISNGNITGYVSSRYIRPLR